MALLEHGCWVHICGSLQNPSIIWHSRAHKFPVSGLSSKYLASCFSNCFYDLGRDYSGHGNKGVIFETKKIPIQLSSAYMGMLCGQRLELFDLAHFPHFLLLNPSFPLHPSSPWQRNPQTQVLCNINFARTIQVAVTRTILCGWQLAGLMSHRHFFDSRSPKTYSSPFYSHHWGLAKKSECKSTTHHLCLCLEMEVLCVCVIF